MTRAPGPSKILQPPNTSAPYRPAQQNSLRRLATRTQTPQPTKLRFAAAEMLSICPESWQDRLAQLANRPHTYLPLQVFNEADNPSQLFQYYLLDTTGFEPNVFTTIFPGVNDHVQLSVTGANCGLPTVGAVRVVLEPERPARVQRCVHRHLSVVRHHNESGWYEGWMIHDITVPNVAPPRKDGHAQFGTITQRDPELLARMGTGNNVPGHIFTVDGRPPHFPSASDHFPDVQTTSFRSMRAWVRTTRTSSRTCTRIGSSTISAPTGSTRFTNAGHRRLPRIISGNLPTRFKMARSAGCSRSFPARDRAATNRSRRSSAITRTYPAIRTSSTATSMRSASFAKRGVPSGLANEIYLDVYERPASF
jgi:hypothetical protein